jgi:iron complex transport system substrate-binding protein
MTRGGKFMVYAAGFALGCLILFSLPREKRQQPKAHPWHAQTAPEGTYPLEVVDDLGRVVRLERQPRHFISLAPSITELLFAMDMGDHLMAVTEWCDFPQQARALRDAGAHVGSINQPNRETIAAYRPDLVIGTDFTPPEVYAAIEQPPRTVTLCLKHQGMDDIIEDLRLLGKVTGVPGHALRLINRLKAERAAVEESLAPFRDQPPRRVLFLLSIEPDAQPGWAPGRDTWVGGLIEAAHAVNVAAELGTSWGELSLEALLALDPEVLILREAESPSAQARMEQELARLPEHPVWSQVRAIRDQRVHWVPAAPFTIPGPRVMQAYAATATAVWGGQAAAATR